VEKFRKLKPKSVEDVAAMAEAMFLAGYLDSAADFYKRAAGRETNPEEKAWLLFQTANCLRKTAPQAALKGYDALIAAHPDSLWATVARAQKEVIDWRVTASTAALLKDIEEQNQQSSGLREEK